MPVAEGRSLRVSKKVMEAVDANSGFGLKIPSDASQRGVTNGARGGLQDPATYSWTEALLVTDTKLEEDPTNKETSKITVVYRVADSSPQADNIGKPHTEWYRVDWSALDAGDPSAGRFKMSIIALGKLKQLVEAAGFEIPDDDFDLEAWFQPVGAKKPLIAATVLGKLRDKLGEDQHGAPVRQQEVVRFISVE
jgi:hypothetical protein